jgi:hypothetical protein
VCLQTFGLRHNLDSFPYILNPFLDIF